MRTQFSLRWLLLAALVFCVVLGVLGWPIFPLRWHSGPNRRAFSTRDTKAVRDKVVQWLVDHQFEQQTDASAIGEDEFWADFQFDEGMRTIRPEFYRRAMPCGATIVLKLGVVADRTQDPPSTQLGWEYLVTGRRSYFDPTGFHRSVEALELIRELEDLMIVSPGAFFTAADP